MTKADLTPPPAPHAFTLVELLVVISVIAILMTVLLPVFSSVRETARKTKCRHQLSQFVDAAKLYADSFGGHHDYFPVDPVERFGPENLKSSYVIQIPGRNEPVRTHHGLLFDPAPQYNKADSLIGDDPSMFACPSTDSEVEKEDFIRLDRIFSDYWWLNGDHEDADKVSELTANDPASEYPFFWDRHGNHEEGVNAGFRDGHGEWLDGEFGKNEEIGLLPSQIRAMLKSLREASSN